ncbi:MAG: glycosyltransferase [Rivularia sp. (in: cyanobacteria)]
MKTLIVTPYLGSTYGGTSKVVTEIVQGLASLVIDVDLITTNANGLENLDVPLNTWITQKDYRIKYFPCWHRNDFIISPSLTNWLFKNIINYNIVHTHTIFSPLISLAHWACQYHKIPYIMTPHGMLDPWALSYKARKKLFYYNLLEKPALRQANAIQVLASSEAEQLKSLGFQNSIVVPNGIHQEQFETLAEPELFYQKFPETRNKSLILFLGRIDPKKGLDLLAPAFAKVQNKFPQTHLIVAGPDSISFLPTVENYFKQAGCLDAVTFTGMLKGSLKHAALAAANLYVAPSYSEGFSMSVLEGMASGLPCVITTGCNFPEAAAAQAAYVVDINADAIADALIECLSNPQQSKQIGDRARQFIFQNYTWEQAAKKLSQVYEDILLKHEANKFF